MNKAVVVLGMLLISAASLAQQSQSFELSEHSFNAGGHPDNGTILASPNFQMTLDAIGDSVASLSLSSTGFTLDGGFITSYRPPGEVTGLLLTDKDTLVWDAEPSAGLYNLYRDDTGDGYGSCEEQNLLATTTTDSSTPTIGNIFHYLVTVKNRLAEEGTKGFQRQ